MAKLKKGTRIRVKSSNTGLTFDGPVESIDEMSKHFEDKWQTQQNTDFTHSLTIYNIIKSTKFKTYKKTLNKKLYRLTFGGCSPFYVAGNLADGGRFNIGGEHKAQLLKNILT